jgi:hypothetical protein
MPLIHFMGRIFNYHNNRAQESRHFIAQKMFVEQHYEKFHCAFRRGVLECVGNIRPTDYSPKYRIRIRYRQYGIPSVRILDPYIERSARIHMYSNGDLCLYHPPSQPWSGDNDLHKTIIPWTAEWLVFYELYLSEGCWLGPAVLHDTDLTATNLAQR